MSIINEFIHNYGATILSTIVTAIAGYLGLVVKNLYTRYINDQTKKDVVNTCVQAVEQIYRDIHGEEKLNKCMESASLMLGEKGINVAESEIRMLIEAAVSEFNHNFGSGSASAAAGENAGG